MTADNLSVNTICAANPGNPTKPDPSLPLAGMRIIDITVVWAGPYATMQLADWGAEIIRVESTTYFRRDDARGDGTTGTGERSGSNHDGHGDAG